MVRLFNKILIVFFIALFCLAFIPKEVAAAVSWVKEPYLNGGKNRILFHIKKDNGDEFLVVLYVDGKPIDEINCGKGTSNCQTSDNKGGALSLPKSFIDPHAVVKVCSGSGGNHDAKKWNCDGKPLLLEATVDITGAGGNLATPGANPCSVTGTNTGNCKTALGDIPTNPKDFVGKILQIGYGLGGGIAFILMVIGSIRVLTSSGDQQRLAGGRDMIVAAVAGILFIIFSVLILQFIGVEIIGLSG